MHSNKENAFLNKSKVSDHFSDGSSVSSDDDSCSHIESWESSSSTSCSSCSESGSFNGSIEWESETRHDGELFFIKSDPSHELKSVSKLNLANSNINDHGCVPAMKESASKSWRNGGKLVRLIRRRESKRHHNNMVTKSNNSNNKTDMKDSNLSHQQSSTLSDTPNEADLHVVELNVDPWVKPNLGRRATISETLLGLVTTNYGPKIVVADFVPDGVAAKQSLIKLGDQICFINGKAVTAQNFNSHLDAVNVPTTLYVSVFSSTQYSVEKKVNSFDKGSFQTPLAERISSRSSNSKELDNFLLFAPVGILFLQLDGLTEDGPEDQGVVYCYPGNVKTNTLGMVRGTFLTLFQLVPDISNSFPKSSSIFVHNQLVHVIYVQEGRELLLIAVPNSRCSLAEAIKHSSELVRALNFIHQSLSRCFLSRELHPAVNNFMSIFFSRLLLGEKWAEINDTSTLGNLAERSAPAFPEFESLLPAAHLLPLPREAQMQIDDALSELESNDIGDSCENLDCQRLYTILGSCLYHEGYLLASHFTHGDLLDIHAFCRQQGLLQLNQSEPVRSLVIWREVYPSSVSRGLKVSHSDQFSDYATPKGRWFIMIVGQKQDMLVVLLESGGCSVSVEGHPSADVFYVEAAQDTLQHLMKIGVSDIASEWLENQLRPKMATPETVAAARVSTRRVSNLLGLRVPHDPGWQSSFSSILSSPSTRKSSDSLVTGKRKPSPDHSSSGPLHGETSEDSASLVASLPSDDTSLLPIKGRTEQDHRTHVSHSDNDGSGDSDSDWDVDMQAGRRVTSTTNLTDLHTALLKNVEETVPTKLTMGTENIVFHYVHIDTHEGVLLCPVHSSFTTSFDDILSNFRRSALHIHSLFQNTISFKKLKGVEASNSLINKSLVAIKEFGVLFDCYLQSRGSDKAASPLTYWVVGRLFFMPTPREVYVCYEDSAPQNVVELAFRLALSAAG